MSDGELRGRVAVAPHDDRQQIVALGREQAVSEPAAAAADPDAGQDRAQRGAGDGELGCARRGGGRAASA